MLEPTLPGWKVETVGDDIAWMRFGSDGRLWATANLPHGATFQFTLPVSAGTAP